MLIPALAMAFRQAPPRFTDTDAAAAETLLREEAMRMVEADDLYRPDGQLYTVDIAQLAAYAALAEDRELYEPLRKIILDELLVDRGPGDEATGMVAWGKRKGQDLDASGTTETLRAAEALWLGMNAWPGAFDDDRETIKQMALAYARHAGVDRGVWMIRNYFNLQQYTYSTNSFLIDYDPDFIVELAEAFDEPVLDDVAQRTLALVLACRTPVGLLHQNIRPEVATIQHVPFDPAPSGIYSIDGIEQLNNVLAVAERSIETLPEIAHGALNFSREHLDDLRKHYDADTGKPAYQPDGPKADLETWAPLLRLSAELDDADTADLALRHVIGLTKNYPDKTFEQFPAKLWSIGEALLALQTYRYHMKPSPDDV